MRLHRTLRQRSPLRRRCRQQQTPCRQTQATADAKQATTGNSRRPAGQAGESSLEPPTSLNMLSIWLPMPSNRFFIQHCMPSSVDAPRVGRGSLATHAHRIRSQLRRCDQRCWPFSIRSWIGTQHRQPERVHPPDHTSTHPGTHPQRLDVVDPAVGRLAAQLGARLCGAGASKETSAGTTAVAATAAPAETAAAEQPWPPQAPISTESGNLQLATFSKRCSTPHSGCRSGQGRCRHIPPALLPAPPRPPAAAPPAAVAPAAPPAGQVVHAGRLSCASNAYDCRQRAHPQASARRAHGPHSAHSQLRKQSHQRRGRGSMHTQAASESVGLKRP